jgi:hypothetical protein|tara:strand:- start:1406 stop:1717 length:312 start_codon:yes stop_codon:yes gene_type:complete
MMKLKLHWAQRYETIREYPPFELDSNNYPELEMEMLDVYNAGSLEQQKQALDSLEYKMHHTTSGERGETIFEMIGPWEDFSNSQTYDSVEDEGFLSLTEVGDE